MKTGRNELCSCGSGKKSKHCCQSATPSANRGRLGMIVAVIAVVAAIAIVAKTRAGSDDAPAPVAQSAAAAPAPGNAPAPGTPSTPAAPVATPGAPPPGPAPAGKVWSREHGHWHDKPVSNEWVTVTPQKSVPLNKPGAGLPVNIPQPNGPVPAGKVWSPEHGHWHDATTGQAVKQELPKEVASQMKQPGIPADMKNYVWSDEHKHWHRKDATGEHATATILPPGTTSATATKPVNPPR
ncbi:MAG: SEC-C domain-containing protein [Acidobacteria bacterium]|nr:SEC-C domain-containing protein [Acidobacteriota bacterium]